MHQLTRNTPVILQTGFRIFFLGAVAYAVISMVFWFLFYVGGGNIFVAMPLTIWHGHEMVFGFTMAVVAGFLLTAVMNWTGLPTASGFLLLLLFLCWFLARVLAFVPVSVLPTWPKAVCDFLFMTMLIVIILRPIAQAKQWGRQSAVLSKLALLLFSAIAFFWALTFMDIDREHRSLRFAVYMIVSLIFTIGRRIMPFFIEKGVGYPVVLFNSRLLDLISLVLLVAFCVLDVFFVQPLLVAVLALLLGIVHSVRLGGWHTPGIWKKPLLWILFIGYLFLILGFFFKACFLLGYHLDDAALHAFTAGGIGVFTIGMMARVSWGHTGRNIGCPPKELPCIFMLLIVGAVIRIFLPIVNEANYIIYIGFSQILWILAYSLFCWVYFPILISPRPDGRAG